eukprot:jgi/Ulvmu1/8128/UM040_0023.1
MVYRILWATLLGPVCVYGQAVVRSALDLAQAIRRQESLISIESRITGTTFDQPAQNSGVYAQERYKDFPEVPEECLADPGPCLADPAYVTVAVPTTITSSTNSLWDVGFLRRRLLVAQNITLDSIRLQGVAADVVPYIFFFLFTSDASLLCRNCAVEHSCGGGDASFFLQSMRLASLSQTVKRSEDGMSASGTVTLRAAQDVAEGTRSSQTFENGTFRCNHDLLRGVMLDTTVRPEDTCQLESDDGHSYRGTKNTTRSGYTCQRWDATRPVFHNRLPSAFPGAGLVDNYCRNPDNEADVWCYTIDGPRWESCGVPLCAVEEEEEPVDGGGGNGDPRTAMLAGVLAAVVAALAAVGAVALLLHRRRRRWRYAQHTLDATSSHAKRVMYGGSHSGASEAVDEDGSCGREPSRKAMAVVNCSSEGSGVSATGGPADTSALDAMAAADAAAQSAGGGSGAGGSTASRRSSRAARAAPREELREALAEMEVDASQLVLHELVGRGGFGSVYRGTWRGLNVAVKTVTFQERGGGGGGAQARAIAEAAITFSLSHPHVIATYFHEIKPMSVAPASGPEANTVSAAAQVAPGSGARQGAGAVGAAVMNDERLQDWKLFLVQEFCEGGSLRGLVDRRAFVNHHGRVKLRKCVECLVDIAYGMHYIQEKNIIHGDLTPGNVLIRPHSASSPTVSRQTSAAPPTPDPSSSTPLALPRPHSGPASAAPAPRAWHMLSGVSKPPPHPPSVHSLTDPLVAPAAAASHSSPSAQPVDVAAGVRGPSSIHSASHAWDSPMVDPPGTLANEPGSPRLELPVSTVSTTQFYSAVESMPAHDSPRTSTAAARSMHSGDRGGAATAEHGAAAASARLGGAAGPPVDAAGAPGSLVSAPGDAGSGSGSSAASGGRRANASGMQSPLRAEECFTHIDAAVPPSVRAAGNARGQLQDPAALALKLHQPARQYQDRQYNSNCSTPMVTAWDTEPWQATAKISDFGLSMKLDPAAGHISNMRQGTPFYAAPEVRDAGFLSKAADSFAFGVIMWECFHSVAPYHVNRAGRFVRHPCFPDFPKDCPLSFAVLAVSCLAPAPADRPDFAQICGVLTDLAAHLRGAGDAATSTAHFTLTEFETQTGSPAAGVGAAPAGRMVEDAGSAISGILSRAGRNLPGPATSDSDLSIPGSARPVAGYSTPQLPSMAEVIRSVTAGRAAERAHLLATGRHGLPPAGPSASLSHSHSWSRSAGRTPIMHSASASPSHASSAVASASWHGTAPRSCQEAIPEEEPEQPPPAADSTARPAHDT